jgi:hypothetical protein
MKDMFFKKQINLLHQFVTHSFFIKKSFANYEYANFEFSKHDNMHKGYASQISNYVALKKSQEYNLAF